VPIGSVPPTATHARVWRAPSRLARPAGQDRTRDRRTDTGAWFPPASRPSDRRSLVYTNRDRFRHEHEGTAGLWLTIAFVRPASSLRTIPLATPRSSRHRAGARSDCHESGSLSGVGTDSWSGLHARALEAAFGRRKAHVFPRPSDSVVTPGQAIASSPSITTASPHGSSSRKRCSSPPASWC
jgi:hypothetical protein